MQLTTSIQLIEYIIENRLQVKYANFVYLKTLYINSCIYKYSVKNLADKARKSRTFIKENITFFLQQDWCRMHGKNLIFNTNNHLKQLYEITNNRKCKLDYKDLESLKLSIYSKLIINKKKQVDYIINMKHDLLNPCKLKDHKRAIQRFKGENVKINEKFTISFASLANLFNCSKSFAFKIIEKLINANYLQKQKNIILVLKNCSRKFFKSLCLNSSYFTFKNSLYKTDANNYLLH